MHCGRLMVVVAGRQSCVDGGQVVDGGAELVVRPWWYSVWRDFQWFELVQRGQAAVGIVEKGRGREDGQLLGFSHVGSRARGNGPRERRRRRVRWLGHACIIICPDQATMHEAALGAPLVFRPEALLQMGGAPGSGAVLDRTSGMRALPRVWRRGRFIGQVGWQAALDVSGSPAARSPPGRVDSATAQRRWVGRPTTAAREGRWQKG